MRRVDRSEWFEWMDRLSLAGAVEISPAPSPEPADGWKLASLDYAPFDGLVEIVLEGGCDERVRVLVDHPLEIWVEDTAGLATEILITTRLHPLTIRLRLDINPLAPATVNFSSLSTGRPQIPVVTV